MFLKSRITEPNSNYLSNCPKVKNAHHPENVTAVYAKIAHANTSITESFVVNLCVKRAADQFGVDGRLLYFKFYW